MAFREIQLQDVSVESFSMIETTTPCGEDSNVVRGGDFSVTADAIWDPSTQTAIGVGRNCGTNTAKILKNHWTKNCLSLAESTNSKWNALEMTECDTSDLLQMWCHIDGDCVDTQNDHHPAPSVGCHNSCDCTEAWINGQPNFCLDSNESWKI